MVMITLYARQQKRHRCIEQSFRLCGRGRGWNDLGEWHWNMYINHIWNESPVQVRCMRQGARGWCTGMTQRDGMGKDAGGVFRMRNTCTPVVDSCQYMAKPLQYCKVISLQKKNKFIFKKTNKNWRGRNSFQTHSMRPTSPWWQNQTGHHNQTKGQHHV